MIVQCPSCQFRFTVEEPRVGDISRPRFKCSRCGHYFFDGNIKSSPHDKKRIKVVEQKSRESAYASCGEEPVIKRQIINDRLVGQGGLLGRQSSLSLVGRWNAERQASSSLDVGDHGNGAMIFERMGAVVEKHSLPSFSSSNSSSGTVGNVACWSSSNVKPVPLEDFYIDSNTPKFQLHDAQLQESFWKEQGKDSGQKKVISRGCVDSSDSWVLGDLDKDCSINYHHEDDVLRPLSTDKSKARVNVSRGGGIFRTKTVKTKNHAEQNTTKTHRVVGVLKRRAKVPVLFILFAPICCCFLLLYVAGNFSGFYYILKHVYPSYYADAPQVPPAVGLEISDIRSNLIILDDGKSVLEITGKLFNASSSPFESSEIQVKLFDKQNTEITSMIVPLVNELSKASAIQPLKTDIINSLQKQHTEDNNSIINPNEDKPVRIIITENLNNTAEWFSVRVYSVKKA